MKSPTSLTATVALLALLAVGCTATRTQKSAGETIDDGAITARVKAALIADSTTEARHINVDTRRGVVQLNGFVESNEGRSQAVVVARAVLGVKSVENNLTLQGAERSAGTAVDDGVISAKVKLALAESPATKAREIKVDTRAGIVQLGGWVDSDNARAEASRIARSVEGVVKVDNNLDVKR